MGRFIVLLLGLVLFDCKAAYIEYLSVCTIRKLGVGTDQVELRLEIEDGKVLCSESHGCVGSVYGAVEASGANLSKQNRVNLLTTAALELGGEYFVFARKAKKMEFINLWSPTLGRKVQFKIPEGVNYVAWPGDIFLKSGTSYYRRLPGDIRCSDSTDCEWVSRVIPWEQSREVRYIEVKYKDLDGELSSCDRSFGAGK